MTKQKIIILGYVLYIIVLYLLFMIVTTQMVENDIKTIDSVFCRIFSIVAHAIQGFLLYFSIINITALVGIVISWIRNDRVALRTFAYLLLGTVILTIMAFLALQYS